MSDPSPRIAWSTRRKGGHAPGWHSTASHFQREPALVRPGTCSTGLDAGLGTRLDRSGSGSSSDDPALWNLTHPEHVLALHRRDVSCRLRCGLDQHLRCESVLAGEVRPRRRRRIDQSPGGRAGTPGGGAGPVRLRLPGSDSRATDQVARFREGGRPGEPAAERDATEVLPVPIPARSVQQVRQSSRPLFWSTPASMPCASRPSRPPSSSRCSAKWPLRFPSWSRSGNGPIRPTRPCGALLELGASVIGMNCQPGIDAAVAFAERMSGDRGLSLAHQAERGRSGSHRTAVRRRLPRRSRGCSSSTFVSWAAAAGRPSSTWPPWPMPCILEKMNKE